MAKGRMLHKNISTSRKLSELKTDGARLLYTWLLPHLDIKGRFEANAYVIKGVIMPRLNHIGVNEIESYLQDLAISGLIFLYEINGDRFLQFTKFGEFQNLRDDREAKSDIPDPPQELVGSRSGVGQELVPLKLIEVKLSKDNINNIYSVYQQLINKNSRLVDKAVDKIKSRLKSYSEDELKRAMENFSKDKWWMEHNAGRGVAWFFHSDERIDQFLNLKVKKDGNMIL